MSETDSILQRISKLKDEALEDMTRELLTNPRFAQALGAAVQRVTRTKSKMNRNIGLMLSLSGLPNKQDYDSLSQRAQSLGKTVARLEERIDAMTMRLESMSERLEARKGAGV